MYTLSVSSLNEQIKSMLESSFVRILVEGELSRITYHNSGHIYFTLKDSNSSIKAVMFRGNASNLKFRLEEGLNVIVDGAISVYKPRGEYQINSFSIQPSGQGALALAYDQLKEKLLKKGYFETSSKKGLPRFPQTLALITSATGAALQDMLRVANTRYRNITIDVYDVLVQGDSSAISIVNAIKIADKKEYDVIVLGRGGGSIEDLWSFNEEVVADAIYNADTPIISAVGHEIDWVISDYVADVRAATPSMAMQICLPDSNELYIAIDTLVDNMTQTMSQKIFSCNQKIEHLKKLYSHHSIERQLSNKTQEVLQMKERYNQTVNYALQGFFNTMDVLRSRYPSCIDVIISNKTNKLNLLLRSIEMNNPKLKSKKGFAQISINKKVVEIEDLKLNEQFQLQSEKVYIDALVVHKTLK